MKSYEFELLFKNVMKSFLKNQMKCLNDKRNWIHFEILALNLKPLNLIIKTKSGLANSILFTITVVIQKRGSKTVLKLDFVFQLQSNLPSFWLYFLNFFD